MIKNHLKITWRNLERNKVSSIINISGLAIGLACVFLIGMYVKDELGYDSFFKDASRIYRVNLEGNMGGDQFIAGQTPPPVGADLKNTFPQVESYTRLYSPGDEIIHYENNAQQASLTERKALAVDSNFLKFFNYPLVSGDASTCLNGINSIVLTQKAAKKYFGDASPVGKTLIFDNYAKPFTVTAVLKDIAPQSSLQFDVLQSTASTPLVKRFNWSWVWLQMCTYVKLRPNIATDATSMAGLDHKLQGMVKVQAATAFKRIGQSFDEFKRKGGKWDLHLQPLTSQHLYSGAVSSRFIVQSDIKYVYIFSAVGLFIILLACVNFTNLATAQAGRRAKEVGIRKVLGSGRNQLVGQFISESMVYSLLAAIVAIMIVAAVLPAFNQLSGKTLSLGVFHSLKTWLGVLSLVVVTGFLAGLYPAFFLTSLKPVSVLKGVGLFSSSGSGLFTRNALVVFQFAVSTTLIICTIVVYKQLIYNQTKDLGFNKQNLVVIGNADRLDKSAESLRQALLQMPQVTNATISTSLPSKKSFEDGYRPESNGDNITNAQNEVQISSFIVDDAFIPTLQLKLVAGRAFSKSFTDSASVIINTTCAKMIGWKDPVGKTLTYHGNNDQKFTIIGVVKDFNIESLHSDIAPFALFYSTSNTYQTGTSFLTVKIRPGDYRTAINIIQNKWKEFAPNTPFDYSFMDTEFDALYKADQTMGKVFSVFTFLSLSVACLGLLGLAIYTAERRTREIGIRKVLGASVQNMVAMLSMDFLKLVIIASVVAFPVAWYAMNKWLQDFAFRTNISWWVFAVSAGLTVTIALVTVSFQAIKAALANPVKSLRSE